MLRILAALFVLLGICGQANAQSAPVVLPAGCGTASYSGAPYFTVDSTGKECVNATVNASVGGFVPSLSYATLTATASTSASTALPTNTGTVAFQNNTSVAVSCTLASGSAVATTNEIIVPAGSAVFLGTTGYDHAACINTTGSASNVIVLAGGAGLGTGFGGGSSGGGGGGGAITAASGSYAAGAFSAGVAVAGSWLDGAIVTLGAKADAHSCSSASAIACLGQIDDDIKGSIPAGSAIIGKVGIDQTTPGTTNGVVVNSSALPTGAATSALQSTINTTLGSPFQAGGALGSSTNTIGSVKQTDGTTVVVTDPCQGSTKSYLPITATTSLVKVIATGVSAKKIYVCQLLLTVTAADNVAVFEATTGTTCATSPVAVYGAGTSVATAANGFPFPANGGVSLGMGGFSVGQTTVNNNDLCIATSAATPLTGGITYVTQ